MALLRFLIQSNFYISFAAVLLTMSTQIQLGLEPHYQSYLILLFFSTLSEYNVHRFVTVTSNKDSLETAKHHWVKSHFFLFYALVAFSIVGLLVAITLVQFRELIVLFPAALITILYSVPPRWTNIKARRLRDFPYLKIFLIAIIWSYTTVALPSLEIDFSAEKMNIGLIFMERFLFIFAITIPFDIRDKEYDKQSDLKTIPMLLTDKKALQLAQLLLFLFVTISAVHYAFRGAHFLVIAFIISGLSTSIMLNNKKLAKHPLYYYGFLDGTMLLQGTAVLLSYYWWVM